MEWANKMTVTGLALALVGVITGCSHTSVPQSPATMSPINNTSTPASTSHTTDAANNVTTGNAAATNITSPGDSAANQSATTGTQTSTPTIQVIVNQNAGDPKIIQALQTYLLNTFSPTVIRSIQIVKVASTKFPQGQPQWIADFEVQYQSANPPLGTSQAPFVPGKSSLYIDLKTTSDGYTVDGLATGK